jgi:hypothetical protein
MTAHITLSCPVCGNDIPDVEVEIEPGERRSRECPGSGPTASLPDYDAIQCEDARGVTVHTVRAWYVKQPASVQGAWDTEVEELALEQADRHARDLDDARDDYAFDARFDR